VGGQHAADWRHIVRTLSLAILGSSPLVAGWLQPALGRSEYLKIRDSHQVAISFNFAFGGRRWMAKLLRGEAQYAKADLAGKEPITLGGKT
jgi:hypothetical protein